MDLKTGRVVKSLSGHDKDKYYVVVRIGEGLCWIADGKRRKLCSPKKKNPRHLQATSKMIELQDVQSDRALRRALAQLCQVSPDQVSDREENTEDGQTGCN